MTKRKVIAFIGAIALLLIAGWVFRYWYLSVSYQGAIADNNVHSSVAIYRLDTGYPLIVAHNRNDAMYALGFVHAQDRLTQIETLRIVSSGNCAAKGFSHFEKIDKLVHAAGILVKATIVSSELSPPYKEQLQCYVDGINAYKFRVSRGSVNDEQWSVEDVVRITIFAEFCNAFLTNSELLFPVRDDDFPLFNREIENKKIVRTYKAQDEVLIEQLKKLQDIVIAVFGLYGSYCRGFALALPSRAMFEDTSTLCVSYEHGVAMYPLLYPVRIQIDDTAIEGVTFAGLPYVIAGKTKSMRYASFSLLSDSQLFYKYQLYSKDGKLYYLSRTGYKELTKHCPDPDCVTRITESGPVISDAFENMRKDTIIALSYVSPEKGYFESLLDMPFAASVNDGIQITRKYQGQPRVVVMQDDVKAVQVVTGNSIIENTIDVFLTADETYAKNIQGIFDIRQSEFCCAGSEFIEKPAQTVLRIMVFNNMNRYHTLVQELSHYSELQYHDIERILHSIKYPLALDYITLTVNLLKKMPITSARLAMVYFNEWDLTMSSDSVAPTLFTAIIDSLIKDTFSDELPYITDDLIQHYIIFEPEFLRLLKEDKSIYFDDITTLEKTETRDMIFDRAFLHSMKIFNYSIGPYIDDWKWGRVHTASIGDISADSVTAWAVKKSAKLSLDGSYNTVYRSSMGNNGFSVNTVTVCSLYMNNSLYRISLLTGITNNTLSKYYTDFAGRGAFNEYKLNNNNELFLITPEGHNR